MTEASAAEAKIIRENELSTDQLACIRHVFHQFDVDDNGSLTASELAHLSAELGEELDDDELRVAMSRLDTNSNHKISWIEFLIWWCDDEK